MKNDKKSNNPWIIRKNDEKITKPLNVPILTNIRKIYQNEITNIINIRSSEIAKRYLNNNIDWHPKYTLEIQIWNKKHCRYLSDKILWSAHTYVVWYCVVDWELRARTFRRSNSEWCRRAWLWEDISSSGLIIISKWEKIKNATYETTTKVDYRISEKLDRIPNSINSNLGNHPLSSLPGVDWVQLGTILKKEMESKIKIYKLFENYPYTSSCGVFRWKLKNNIIRNYKNLQIKWLDLENLSAKENGNYSYNHKYLWPVYVKICTTTWNGVPIDIHFARARDNSPEKIWIDNIVFSDAKINSFWTYDKQINAAPLTAKPIEYITQAPIDMVASWHQVFEDDLYVDIRDLYQETPLIRKCKEKFCR